jgi:hypothetical protein
VSGAACASGGRGATGRLCPQVEHAPVTLEGFSVLRLVKRFAAWEGGGFAPLRIDREQLLRRLPPGADPEAAEDMVDAFEAAATAAMADRRKTAPKTPN